MQQKKKAKPKVGILVFDGVQIIDFTGPYEVFGQGGFEASTVAVSLEPIVTTMNMKVVPTFCMENAPEYDVLVVPGGEVDACCENKGLLEWLNRSTAEIVMSVCNGAFILAAAGMLEGLKATTYYQLLDELAETAPGTRVLKDQRFVDNGRILTTAGLTSGLDGALHVVSKLKGKATAQRVALNMEYNWRPDFGYARAALADRFLLPIFTRFMSLELPDGSRAQLISTEGAATSWEARWRAPLNWTPEVLLKHINHILLKHKWFNVGTELPESTNSLWEFQAEDGGIWSGIVNVIQESSRHLIIFKVYDMGIRH